MRGNIFRGEMQCLHLREPKADQSTDTTEVQLGEPMRSWGRHLQQRSERSLKGAEMTQRQLRHQSPHQPG